MKTENLKNELAKKIVLNHKVLVDLKKALVGLSQYAVGDRIEYTDYNDEKIAGVVKQVKVVTEGFQCPIRELEDGSVGFVPVFLYEVQLFKANGQLGQKTTTHTVEIAED